MHKSKRKMIKRERNRIENNSIKDAANMHKQINDLAGGKIR